LKAVAKKIRIGVSACLLGQKVRFNGGHKEDDFIFGTLSNYFEWVPVCPEVDIGLGVPRESMRLIRAKGEIRLVTNQTGEDHTEKMRAYAKRKSQELRKMEISGYLFKKGSPSCGMERVNAYTPKGALGSPAVGLFAETLMATISEIPVEEEGRLRNPVLRENWIERVFAFERLRDLWETKWSIGDLVAFHTRNKMALLAHSEQTYRRMGRLVASAKKMPREKLKEDYEGLYLEALKTLATRKKNTNVLEHMTGYFKTKLDKASKEELAESVKAYHQGQFPITVPLTLIKHHVRVHGIEYLRAQTFLNPHPQELSLRNFIA